MSEPDDRGGEFGDTDGPLDVGRLMGDLIAHGYLDGAEGDSGHTSLSVARPGAPGRFAVEGYDDHDFAIVDTTTDDAVVAGIRDEATADGLAAFLNAGTYTVESIEGIPIIFRSLPAGLGDDPGKDDDDGAEAARLEFVARHPDGRHVGANDHMVNDILPLPADADSLRWLAEQADFFDFTSRYAHHSDERALVALAIRRLRRDVISSGGMGRFLSHPLSAGYTTGARAGGGA